MARASRQRAAARRLPSAPQGWAASLVAVLLVAGCGDSPSSEAPAGDAESAAAYDELDAELRGLEGSERERRLEELAEEEGGELSLYTSLFDEAEQALEREFEAAYDGIDVTVYRGESEEVAQRISEEASAGQTGADVVETNGPELELLADQDLLEPYDSDYVKELRPDSAQGDWVTDRFNQFAISWNTDLVPRGEEPGSWEELADPRWDGQVALEASDSDWYKTLYEYWTGEQGKSPEEADRLFEEIAGGARVIDGHSLVGELLSAGEYEVAASNYVHLIQDEINGGAPVVWKPPVEPVISRPNGVALLRDAPHPAAATLFTDWILSDGQEVLLDFALEPARRDLQVERGLEQIQVDVPDYVAETEEWTDRYDALIRLGEAPISE